MACGIIVPLPAHPGIEPGPSAVEAQNLMTGHQGIPSFLEVVEVLRYELSLSHFTLSVKVFHSFFPVLKKSCTFTPIKLIQSLFSLLDCLKA